MAHTNLKESENSFKTLQNTGENEGTNFRSDRTSTRRSATKTLRTRGRKGQDRENGPIQLETHNSPIQLQTLKEDPNTPMAKSRDRERRTRPTPNKTRIYHAQPEPGSTTAPPAKAERNTQRTMQRQVDGGVSFLVHTITS